MVPIPLSPLSLKRSTSPNELEEDDRTSKRSKTSKTADKDGLEAQTPEYMGLVADLYDEKPRQLLMRSVALALEHVGFDGATPEAIEAICSEADVCKTDLDSGHFDLADKFRCGYVSLSNHDLNGVGTAGFTNTH